MGQHTYVRARLAARTAVATVLAMVLGSVQATGSLLAVKFLVPVLAILATQRTLGQTIRSSFLLVKGALIGVALTLVPLLVLPRHPAVLFSLLLLCSGAVAAFTKVPPVTKLALAVVVLECVVSLDASRSSAELAVQLLLAVACGCLCAVAALLLPRPHTARAAIATEASNAFEACGFALPHLSTAFSTDSVADARVALGRARHTLRSALEGCRRADTLVPFVAWESYPGAAPSATYLAVLCQALLALLRSLDEMCTSLGRMERSPTQAEYVARMSHSARKVCDRASSLMLSCAAAAKQGHALPLSEVHDVEEALQQLSAAFSRARRALLFNLHEEGGEGGDTGRDDAGSGGAGERGGAPRALVEEIGDRVGQGAADPNVPVSSSIVAALQSLPVRRGATESLQFTVSAKLRMAHVVFSLGNFVRGLLHLPDAPSTSLGRGGEDGEGELALLRAGPADAGSRPTTPPPPQKQQPPQHSDRGEKDVEAPPPGVPSVEACTQPSFPYPTEAAPNHLLASPAPQAGDSSPWRAMARAALPQWRQATWLHGARLALAIGLSGSVAFIPQLATRFPQPFWAPLTVAFVAEARVGGTLRTSMLRLQGTVLGAVAGYLLVLAWGDAAPLLLGGTALWVMLSAYCRTHPTYAYGALVSAFTAPLVVMGHGQTEGLGAREYAGLRIEHTVLGILALALVNNLVAPTRAATAVVAVAADACHVASDLFQELISAYATRKRASDDAHTLAPACAVAQPRSLTLQGRLEALLRRAEALAADAEAETLLATGTQLPRAFVARVLEAAGRVARATAIMDWALTRMLSVRRVAVMGSRQRSTLLAFTGPVADLFRAQQRALALLRRRLASPTSVPASRLDALVTQLAAATAVAEDANSAFSTARRDFMFACLRRHDTPQFANIDVLTFDSFCYALEDAVRAMRDLSNACADSCVFAMDDA